MADKIINKEYSGFSFEEFLQDDFFISSMNQPTPDTIEYWDHFRKENEGRCDNFDAARDYLASLNTYYTSLSPSEIKEMEQNIIRKKEGKIKTPVRRFVYWSISAAASVTLVIYFMLSANRHNEMQPAGMDILSFASQYSASGTPSDEIQLVLSEEKTLVLDPADSEITYDTTGINISNSSQISRSETSSFNQLIVPFGKRSVLNFSDGSKIWVNSGSRLVYPVVFDDYIREIYVDGEIYIDVAPEKKRPFVVRTKDMNIQVLGTRFNITAYETDQEKKVVLVSGSVQISSKEDPEETILQPNQMYRSENGQNSIEAVDTEKYISWIDRIYYCENESLGSILQRLSRYYGAEIICDPAISSIIFSGKLDMKESLTDIFKGIAFTLPISYENSNGKYIITQLR